MKDPSRLVTCFYRKIHAKRTYSPLQTKDNTKTNDTASTRQGFMLID